MKERAGDPLRHDLFYGDALIFEKSQFRESSDREQAYREGCGNDVLGISAVRHLSAKNDGPYVCLEPWTGCATLKSEGDEFLTKRRNTTFFAYLRSWGGLRLFG